MAISWAAVDRLQQSLKERRGQALVEYGLILTLVLLAALAGLALFGHDVARSLWQTANEVHNAP